MKSNLSKSKTIFYVVCGLMLLSSLIVKHAIAHHGGASAAFGPGSPVETTAPLTLPEGMFLLYDRFELAPYEKYSRNNPENVDKFIFNTAMLGYGIKDSLSAYVQLPYARKEQDKYGVSTGLGDIEFLFQYGFKYGVKDGIAGWYAYGKDDTAGEEYTADDYKFTLFGGFSIPTGTISNYSDVDEDGDGDKDIFGMGMQPGFAVPSFNFGIASSKLILPYTTLTADFSLRAFAQSNEGRPGNEVRGNLALGYCVFSSEKKDSFLSRVDLIGEANFLHLDRDQDSDRRPDHETGGNILYLSPAIRVTFLNRLSLGVMIKFPSILDLNTQSAQQGAEGLEKYRFITTASLSF